MNSLEFEIVEFIPHEKEHKATFYSIKLKGERKSEADKFFEEFENSESKKLDNFLKNIQYMIERRGCIETLFKLEESSPLNNICALWEGYLRLYCLRYGKVAVILGGGGMKKVRKYQDSAKLNKHIKLLEAVCKQIDKRITEHEIRVLNNKLVGDFKFKILE